MTKRAFMIPLYVLIDEDDARENEQRDENAPSVTFKEAVDFLNIALASPDLMDEEHGNPIGVQSLNRHTSEMTELSQDELREMFGSYCPVCETHFSPDDESERTMINDHGKCYNCHKRWQVQE
jgi:hypothetical protein